MKAIPFYFVTFILWLPLSLAAQEEGSAYDIESKIVLISHTKPGASTIMGTGFFVSPTGIVVTADHVIYDELNGIVHPRLFARRLVGKRYFDYKLNVVKRFKKGLLGRDIAVLRIAGKPEDDSFPYFRIADKPKAGSEVIIAGYPLIFDKVKNFPLLRRGIISSTNYTMADAPIMILDLVSTNGYSGSPIVDSDTGMVVGVMKGGPKERPETDFSIAFVLSPNDIEEK